MKTDRTAPRRLDDPACGHGVGGDAVVPAGSGTGTRALVARVLMEQGPVTAAVVAAELELTEAAVRRHLDALIADGEAEVRAPARSARPRGRGRPAREYLLTDTGRVRFGHGYDDLATQALRFLAETAGEEAVDAFARHRVRKLLGSDLDAVTAPAEPAERVEALARVLSARGYAAQARHGGFGVQLCQHHCPVAHVATEFPELCEAETRAFAELLGTHVQRLATIARGDAACTTHVPLEDPELLARARGKKQGRSVTVSGRPTAQVRQVQEEGGPADGGTLSHHGPRKGGSPYDDHS